MGAIDTALSFVRGGLAAVTGGSTILSDGEEVSKAMPRADQFPPPVEAPKAMFYDPFALIDQMGYKERPSAITYYTLESMAMRDAVIAAIIQTRVNQLAAFAHKQRTPYDMGFRIKLRGSKRRPTRAEQKEIEKFENLVLNTGVVDEPGERDNFETFLRKTARDSLVLDQFCAEVIPNRRGKPAAFIAVDASTIRLAEDWALQPDAKKLDDKVAYVQIYDGTVVSEFTRSEMIFGVRNPRTSIRQNGYGFCLHPSSRVQTTEGPRRIADLSGRDFSVLIGGVAHRARAFVTGERQVFRTRFADGREILTSPDHNVRVFDETGALAWRRVADLRAGDTVACDITPVTGGKQPAPFKYTPEGNARSLPWEIGEPSAALWELLGWLAGDGNYRVRGRGDGPRSAYGRCFSLFYAKYTDAWGKHVDEEPICDRHRMTLEQLGLPAPKYARPDGVEVKFNHEGFGRWFERCGGGEQRVPEAVFGLPMESRAAYLRGLFSADGMRSKNDHVSLGCTDPDLLADAQRLLWSLGIRSRIWSGWANRDLGFGLKPYRIGRLDVYDTDLFDECVGFIQAYKCPVVGAPERQGTRADVVCASFARRFALRVQDSVPLEDRRRIRGLLEATPRWGVTRRWIRSRLPEGAQEFDDLRWHHGMVASVEDTGATIEMLDVEVFSSEHAFVVDGVIVHNSELEMLITTITAHLWAEEYNRRFFSSGSSIKGVLNIKGFVPDEQLKAFRRAWYSMVSGVSNAFRTPILNGEDVQWISMHQNNKDMEFSNWVDYLIKVACSVFQISPDEVGFEIRGSGAGGGGPMFESNNESRLRASRDKGLRPLIRAFFGWMNQGIIWPLDPDFEIAAAGIDSKSEEQRMELATKAVHTYMTVDEIRADHDLPAMPDEKGDVVLDPTWLQFAQAKDMPPPGEGPPGGPDGGAPPPGGDGGLQVPDEEDDPEVPPELPDDDGDGADLDVPDADMGEPLDGKSEDAPRSRGSTARRFVVEI